MEMCLACAKKAQCKSLELSDLVANLVSRLAIVLCVADGHYHHKKAHAHCMYNQFAQANQETNYMWSATSLTKTLSNSQKIQKLE